MLLTGGGVGQLLLFARGVMRKSARGQHHAAAGVDLDLAIWRLHHGAGHARAVFAQTLHGAVDADLHAQSQG